MVPELKWRIIGDRESYSEYFIPMHGPRDLAILKAYLEGPSEEDRLRWQQEADERERARVEQMDVDRARHEHLVVAADPSSVVATLLAEHAPHESAPGQGRTYLVCHTCPSYYVTEYDVTDMPEWPCRTWRTISSGM